MMSVNADNGRHEEVLKELHTRLVHLNTAICSLEKLQQLEAGRMSLAEMKRMIQEQTG
jgi:hypothetical protein